MCLSVCDVCVLWVLCVVMLCSMDKASITSLLRLVIWCVLPLYFVHFTFQIGVKRLNSKKKKKKNDAVNAELVPLHRIAEKMNCACNCVDLVLPLHVHLKKC